MESRSDQHNENGSNDVMKYVGIVMALLYVGLGIAILVGQNNFFNIQSKYIFPLGAMLIVYGLFRAYRIYQKGIKD
jgi:hypothetical protein